jgi:uncharacterized protein with HEPN domain
MNKSPVLYLGHMLECVTKILEYTQNFSEQDFLNSSMVQDAVVRNFEVLGEAVKQLDDEFKLRYPDVPWKSIAGMRDKLIHNYMGVDLQAVWAVVHDIIPMLNERIVEIKKELENRSNDS